MELPAVDVCWGCVSTGVGFIVSIADVVPVDCCDELVGNEKPFEGFGAGSAARVVTVAWKPRGLLLLLVVVVVVV